MVHSSLVHPQKLRAEAVKRFGTESLSENICRHLVSRDVSHPDDEPVVQIPSVRDPSLKVFGSGCDPLSLDDVDDCRVVGEGVEALAEDAFSELAEELSYVHELLASHGVDGGFGFSG